MEGRKAARGKWKKIPPIVALGQSGGSGQDFVRDLIGGKFVCQLRSAEKFS